MGFCKGCLKSRSNNIFHLDQNVNFQRVVKTYSFWTNICLQYNTDYLKYTLVWDKERGRKKSCTQLLNWFSTRERFAKRDAILLYFTISPKGVCYILGIMMKWEVVSTFWFRCWRPIKQTGPCYYHHILYQTSTTLLACLGYCRIKID